MVEKNFLQSSLPSHRPTNGLIRVLCQIHQVFCKQYSSYLPVYSISHNCLVNHEVRMPKTNFIYTHHSMQLQKSPENYWARSQNSPRTTWNPIGSICLWGWTSLIDPLSLYRGPVMPSEDSDPAITRANLSLDLVNHQQAAWDRKKSSFSPSWTHDNLRQFSWWPWSPGLEPGKTATTGILKLPGMIILGTFSTKITSVISVKPTS